MLHSYPNIFSLGHKAVVELLLDPVVVQEKVDGSQISFGVIPQSDGISELRVRSKGAELNIYAPDHMFSKGVEAIKAVQASLVPGWVYRGEYLAKPKHNALAYDRVPKNYIILFDVEIGPGAYLGWREVEAEATRLGFEAVPTFECADLSIAGPKFFREQLKQTSCLGGCPVEGVVVKNYFRFGPDKKPLMSKFVSEQFKEVHAEEWKQANPKAGDIIDRLIRQFKTEARWVKALQHLREAGQIEDAPRDIGKLIPEVIADTEKECAEEIKDALYAWAWPKLRRAVTYGLPEWYKERLLTLQFEREAKPKDDAVGVG